ncbi:MAG TPA: 1-phosphofructokinase [Actinocrinis sp.]|uniref:1-phosphofructokinase n=1 Tax=Actinocrinis sp. TaxID=1920516 RepID=UPI002D722759|nr:1-phosphofructokinase [Actinocrinis sp.]HZU56411.1 1-phosphofructokinase [Actinocrinis sp.]
MIVTLTLNPSLDRTLEVDALRRGEVLRAASVHLDPGGKGVNVARALLANGVGSRAVIPCGGAEGEQLVLLLAEESVHTVAVPIASRTRSNVTLVEADGAVTKVNEPGAPLTAAEFDAVAAAVLGCAGTADWVVMCGSLPPDVPVDVYAGLTAQFAAAGIRVAVDTSGPALLSAVAAGPDLVKPNRDELAEAVGAPLTEVGEVIEAAQTLRERGAGAVLASLGADGALLVDDDGVLLAQGTQIEPRSTVGAGDALLAGFLAGGARGEKALVEAVAWGGAAVGLPGSRMPGPADIRREGIVVVDLTREPGLPVS